MVGNASSNNVATDNDASGAAFSLENILGDKHDTLEHPGLKQQELDAQTTAEGWDEESANRPIAEGFCVECEGEWPRGSGGDDRADWVFPWQTNPHNYHAKNARTTIAKCASPRNIERDLEKSTQSRPSIRTRRRTASRVGRQRRRAVRVTTRCLVSCASWCRRAFLMRVRP